MQNKQKWQEQSSHVETRDVLFGAGSLRGLRLLLPPTQHTLSHGSEFRRCTECVHTILLPVSFDLSKALTLIGTDPEKTTWL